MQTHVKEGSESWCYTIWRPCGVILGLKHILHAVMQVEVPVLTGSGRTELTIATISVVSVPRVSFSLSGGACLACSFTGLFSSRGTVSVSGGSSSSATCRFGRGGQGGALLLFSLSVSRSRLSRTDETFSITPLCTSEDIEEESMTCTVKNRTQATFKTRGGKGHADVRRLKVRRLLIVGDHV